jgi:dolichyldiphosphatase
MLSRPGESCQFPFLTQFKRSFMKTPVSFFLVEYNQADHVGYLLAFLSFTPPFLVAIETAVYCTLLAASRNVRTRSLRQPAQMAGYLLLGQLLNEIFNLVLKNVLRQPRPSAITNYRDYGMPSSHAQFMAFLAAIFPRLSFKITRKLLKWPWPFTAAANLACFAGTLIIAYGRYHSSFICLL